MTPNSRWKAITESQFAWERDALEFIREQLPDHDPWRAWSNFEFIADDGSVNEVDLLVLAPRGCFLVEIKSRSGALSGDAAAWTWTDGGSRFTDDNPLLLANRKAKKLASLLRRQKAIQRVQCPFIEALVFCSNVTEVHLSDTARIRLCLKDRPERENKPERPGIIKALTERVAAGIDPYRGGITDNAVARAVAQAMEQAGIRPSRRSQQIGGFTLQQVLGESHLFQDRLGMHERFPADKRRIRVFYSARGAAADIRQMIGRAAEREYQLLSGLNHAGVLRPQTFVDSEHGPAIVFEYDPTAVRLDHFMREWHDRLDVGQRLTLLRQIAEVIRYSHQRHVVHRALSPQSILVLNPDSPELRRIQLFNWTVGSRQGLGTTTAAGRTVVPTISATSHVEQLVEDTASVFMAPESLRGEEQGSGEHLDIFSLGALAFYLFSGRVPAETAFDLSTRVREDNGLLLSSVLDGANEHLQILIRFATAPLVSDRPESVDEFLELLTRFEEDITAPSSEDAEDPCDAKPGAKLDHGLQVVKRIGSGSTSVALLVRRESDGTEHVLKVARDFDQNERLRVEGETLKKFRHAHVVECHAVFEFGERVGLLLQKAGELTLGQKIKAEGRLQLELLERFGEDLLDTMRYLDDHGVWHRDIKPDNIGVSKLGRGDKLHLILFDFSLANAPVENINAGTRPYLDPFLADPARKKRWDSHAERFAAAMTLYEMATGTLPKWGTDGSDPLMSAQEVAIDSDLMDSSSRELLTSFFRRALARDVAKRFENPESMLKAWREVFSSAGRPVVGATQHGDDDGGETVGLRNLETARADTPLVELGLSTRALNALDRLDVHVVKEFLGLRFNRWTKLPGVGTKTRNELHRAYTELQARFPDIQPKSDGQGKARSSDDVAPTTTDLAEEPVPAVISVDWLARRVQGKKSASPTSEDRAIPLLLGLAPSGERELGSWPSQTEVADALDLTRARIGQIVAKRRVNWGKDSHLSTVRQEVFDLLNAGGGVMTSRELASALLAAHGSACTEPRRTAEAVAVLRAAVETEQGASEVRFIIQRHGSHVLVARDTELADYAIKLADKADALALADPLPSPQRIVEELGRIKAPILEPDMPTPSEVRRVQLAAAVSENAAVNGKLEIYPRKLPARRALRLAMGAIFGYGETLSVQQIQERVRSRYPEAERLPDRPDLDAFIKDLFEQARVKVEWDQAADNGRGAYRVQREANHTITGSASTLERQNTYQHTGMGSTQLPAALPDEIVDARDFESRIQRSLTDGAFLVLSTEPKYLVAAESELIRRFPALKPLSLEALLIEHMKHQAQALKVNWNTVLAADGAEKSSQDWQRLLQLVNLAMPGIEHSIRAAAANHTVLLTYTGPLASYQQMTVLERLRDSVGRTDGIHGVWLLIPSDRQNPLPTIDGVAIAVLGSGQHRWIPSSWLENLHRTRAKAAMAAISSRPPPPPSPAK